MQIEFIKEMLAIACPYLRRMAAQSTNPIDDYIVEVLCRLPDMRSEKEKRADNVREMKKKKLPKTMLKPVTDAEKRAAVRAAFKDDAEDQDQETLIV